MNFYRHLPSRESLDHRVDQYAMEPLKVNGHFHTPFSFSAFDSLQQLINMAEEERVEVLGINDFYTMAGYAEFAHLAMEHRKFPLFNIEFMGLLKEEQEKGIRVNDPNNPGRTYFSGKGLDFPGSLAGNSREKLESVRAESEKQTREMVAKAGTHLAQIHPNLSLDYQEILESYTKGMVRERHIAKAIREKIFQVFSREEDRMEILSQILGGKEIKASPDDAVALEG